MTSIIKNVGYGAMVKSMMLRVFLDPKTYMELVNEAKTYKLNAKTDSELIGKVVHYFIYDVPLLRLERDRMKDALAQKNEVINKLQELKKAKK